MARWCYAVNGVAALAYLALMGWGFAARQPAGNFLAVFALIALLPYALMAGLARHFYSSRVVTTTVFVVSLLGAGLTLCIDCWALEGVYQDSLLDKTKLGPEEEILPFFVGAAVALVIWFVLQVFTFGLLFLASLLWQSLSKRFRAIPDEKPPRPLPLDPWRGVVAREIPGGFTRRDQATADRSGLA
jgi:hypothetical protein